MPFFQLLSSRQRRWEGSTGYYTAEEEIGVSMYVELLRGKSYFTLLLSRRYLLFGFGFVPEGKRED